MVFYFDASKKSIDTFINIKILNNLCIILFYLIIFNE